MVRTIQRAGVAATSLMAGCAPILPGPIEGAWHPVAVTTDDTCELGFTASLPDFVVSGHQLTAAGREVIVEEDTLGWRGGHAIANSAPCPHRDAVETWSIQPTADGLVGAYEALFAAGGSCEPTCFVRASFTATRAPTPEVGVAAPGPLGRWAPIPLLKGDALTETPRADHPPPLEGSAPAPSALVALPPNAPRPPGFDGFTAPPAPCPAVVPPEATP
jgi:hypothetical protein